MTDRMREEATAVHTDETVVASAMRWSAVALIVIVAVVATVVWQVRRDAPPPPAVEATVVAPQQIETDATAPTIRFTDITQQAGIDFVHDNGAYGDKLLPETMGGGAAFIDFDNDGDQDLLFVNSGPWPGREGNDPPAPLALYRNDGTGKFAKVDTGVDRLPASYGMGVAIGDFDSDGLVDAFISAVGTNRLLRNTGTAFEDVTAKAGVAGDPADWSTSSTFVDYDNDGDLDLFVGNYVRWSKEIDFAVDYRLVGVGRAYGPPMNYEGAHPYLYRNNGDGTFADVSAEAGMQVANPSTDLPMGKALGVAPIDVDRDGHIDLLVANDTVRNFFFHNSGNGTFAEEGVEFGLAFDRNGSATGAMGIDAAYYRNDDELGFFIGNFANEMTSLYVSQGDPTLFADEAISEGIGSPTRLMLSFGVFLFDYDLDGRLDLLQTNGHLEEEINIVQPSQHYEQAAQLFWNCGMGSRGCFVPVEAASAGDMNKPIVGRGSTYGDIDGDGDLDVVLTQTGRAPLLLRNDQSENHHWVRLKLVGTGPSTDSIGAAGETDSRAAGFSLRGRSNRNAIGAWVEATFGDTTVRRQVMPTRSYLSQVELPVTIGLGNATQLDKLRITWPSGTGETFDAIEVDSTQTIKEGTGTASGG